jgi:membrane protease subunit HflK
VILAVVLLASTSYYQVEPDEVAVVTRFGRFVRITPPGPHGRLPLGMERVQKVPVERQLKQEFGFRTLHSDVQSTFHHDDTTAAERVMLTGDLNVATVEWIVQYKVTDPYKYLFKLRDVEETFRLMTEASMRAVVGDHSVTELLTVGRESIAAAAKELLQHLCKLYDNGIIVQQLVLQDVDPPEPVKPSFNEVNQAIQERERATHSGRGCEVEVERDGATATEMHCTGRVEERGDLRQAIATARRCDRRHLGPDVVDECRNAHRCTPSSARSRRLSPRPAEP